MLKSVNFSWAKNRLNVGKTEAKTINGIHQLFDVFQIMSNMAKAFYVQSII